MNSLHRTAFTVLYLRSLKHAYLKINKLENETCLLENKQIGVT